MVEVVTVSLPMACCGAERFGVMLKVTVPPLVIVITDATATLTVVVVDCGEMPEAAEAIVAGITNKARKSDGIIRRYFFIINFIAFKALLFIDPWYFNKCAYA